MSGRDSKFAAAKKQREQEREKERRRGGGGGSGQYENIHYTALDPAMDKIVRIMGNPYPVRENPWDTKRFLMSMIASDDGGKFRVIWPDEDEWPGWPLWEIYNLVLKSKWVQGDNNKRKREYVHEKTHPTAFQIVAYNNNMDNPYESGWKPQEMVAMNVIDRHDMGWHRENKHTKILSKKASQTNDGNFYFEPGIPLYTYKQIWDSVVEYWDDWHDYDIAIRKKKEQPWYEAFHAEHDLMKLSNSSKPFITEGSLTEEEQAWERYDLDRLYRVTSMIKIENRAIKNIKKIDAEFDTNYAEMIQDMASEERKKLEEEQKNSEQSTSNQPPQAQGTGKTKAIEAEVEEEESEEEEVVETRAPSRPSREPEEVEEREPSNTIPWEKLADGSYNGTVYEGVPEMTKEEKAMVVSVKEDGTFEYVKEFEGQKVKLYRNKQSGFASPGQFHVDPLNGDIFS